MPKLSDRMEEGKILWRLKQPGESVLIGDAPAEVETDKADMEVKAESVVVLDGKVTIADTMRVTLSSDHRVIGRAESAKFLETLILETPYRLLLP